MAITDPRRIVFENENDVIDYVCKGLPPRKANFELVMNKIKFPDSYDETGGEAPNPGSELYIPDSIFMDLDPDTMEAVLRRVYKNRCFHRNCTIGAIALITGAVILGCISGGNENKAPDNDY